MRITFSTPVTPTRDSETASAGRCDWTSAAVEEGRWIVASPSKVSGAILCGPSYFAAISGITPAAATVRAAAAQDRRQ